MDGQQRDNQMQILFLDVDGVLNNVRTRTRTEDGFYFVEDSKIALVKELVEQTGAELVLSSTWRVGWKEIEEGKIGKNNIDAFLLLKNKFLEYDLQSDLQFLSYTPFLETNYRGDEIAAWITQWRGEEIEPLLILDDYTDIKPYGRFFLRTSFMEGITKRHVKKGIQMLNQVSIGIGKIE